jgi:hypothetical protein
MKMAGLRVPSCVAAAICAALLMIGELNLHAQRPGGQPVLTEKRLSAEQLESMVAPIALYPDSLLAQVLVACTYPLGLADADRWLPSKHALPSQDLVQAAVQQDWEPSIQALVIFPTVLHRLSESLKWSTALGNAFLAQPQGVLEAAQAMRRQAVAAGKLDSNAQQTVAVQRGNIIVIQPASLKLVHIPSYDATDLYGKISFDAGTVLDVAFPGCCGPPPNTWGWEPEWSAGTVTVNNNFLGRYGYGTPYRGEATTEAWVHNPYYRGAAPYSSAAVARRYGDAAGLKSAYQAAASMAPQGTAARAVMEKGAKADLYSSPEAAAAEETYTTAFASPGGAARTRANSNRGASSLRAAAIFRTR